MQGRADNLLTLNNNYQSEQNNLTIIYGRQFTGKTTLVNEFTMDKKVLYYEALPASPFMQMDNLNRALKAQDPQYENASDYRQMFDNIMDSGDEYRLLVIEEFQNIIKSDSTFMDVVSEFFQDNTHDKFMMILTSSSVCWIENSMVSAIGRAALSINTFMKLKELEFIDTVRMFPTYDVYDIICMYAVTGGVPGYLSMWNGSESFKSNICRLFLEDNSRLADAGHAFVKDELRETGIYNTIIECLASGLNKLNEIHEYTGYGRDKISVYLKNLIEREIVEKVFSYNEGSNEHTRKGMYRIKDSLTAFWYEYIYPNYSMTGVIGADKFYDVYIAPYIKKLIAPAFVKVASEFIELMNTAGKLPFQVARKGGWYGKDGNLDVIFKGEEEGCIVVNTFTNTVPDVATMEDIINWCGLAGIKAEYFYVFSIDGFSSDLLELRSKDHRINLIGMEDL